MNTTYLSETIDVEVFITNVNDKLRAHELVKQIHTSFDLVSVSFDLEDCDRILRVEGGSINVIEVISILESEGFECVLL